MKKTAVVTGTSSGLGLETALLLAKNNYKVYATMRNLDKAVALKNRINSEKLDVEILELDVTDSDSVNLAIKKVFDEEGRIDLLINNAGSGFAKTTEQATEDEIKWVTDVNYFGVVRCTKAVLPIMRKQSSGHIINVSSVGGLVGQPFNELYCAAKFAVEGFTESMATYLTDSFGINFTSIEPGGITSEFLKSATAKTMTDGQMTLPEYMPILQKYLSGMQNRAKEGKEQVYQTAEEVGEVILNVANSDNPPLRLRTSEWAENFCSLKTSVDPDGTKLVNSVKEKFL